MRRTSCWESSDATPKRPQEPGDNATAPEGPRGGWGQGRAWCRRGAQPHKGPVRSSPPPQADLVPSTQESKAERQQQPLEARREGAPKGLGLREDKGRTPGSPRGPRGEQWSPAPAAARGAPSSSTGSMQTASKVRAADRKPKARRAQAGSLEPPRAEVSRDMQAARMPALGPAVCQSPLGIPLLWSHKSPIAARRLSGDKPGSGQPGGKRGEKIEAKRHRGQLPKALAGSAPWASKGQSHRGSFSAASCVEGCQTPRGQPG